MKINKLIKIKTIERFGQKNLIGEKYLELAKKIFTQAPQNQAAEININFDVI